MQLRSDAVRCGIPRALTAACSSRRPDRRGAEAPACRGVQLPATTSSPGHNNLDKICEAVKAGIYMAGGVPFEISTIGVCDGIA